MVVEIYSLEDFECHNPDLLGSRDVIGNVSSYQMWFYVYYVCLLYCLFNSVYTTTGHIKTSLRNAEEVFAALQDDATILFHCIRIRCTYNGYVQNTCYVLYINCLA